MKKHLVQEHENDCYNTSRNITSHAATDISGKETL
jgi:hypothetical protein